MENSGSNKKVIGGAVVVGLVVVGGLVGWSMTQKETSPTMDKSMTNETAPAVMMEKGYKNGTYQAIGNYTSPGGSEEIDVSLTLTDGVVSEAVVTPKATRPTSKVKQQDFADNYKVLVVGKSIDELNLGKVSGSSLTPKGFNDAVEKIKAQAQS
jgi:hypothetical protein